MKFFIAFPLDFGNIGVSLFIVISGFCIHLGAAKLMNQSSAPRFDWVRFWRRRAYRLYPPYFAAVILGLIVYKVSRTDTMFPWEKISFLPWDIGSHLLMLQNLSPLYWAGVGNFPLWTLGMEEQLYLLYFIFILLRTRLTATHALFVVLITTLSWNICCAVFFPTEAGSPPVVFGQWGMWPFAYWFNWVLGALAAEAYVGLVTLPRWAYRGKLALLLGMVGVLLSDHIMGRIADSHFLARYLHRGWYELPSQLAIRSSPLFLALAFFLFVNRWVRAEVQGRFQAWWIPHLAKLGLFSYSLYLTHVRVLHLLETAIPLGERASSFLMRYLLFTPIALFAAWIFFQVVERRFLNSYSGRVSRLRVPDESPGTVPG